MNDTKTVSGAIVHVTDADEAPLVKCLVTIEPKQSGSGTPSPSNVRQISGWESVNVTDAGKNLSEINETEPTTSVRYIVNNANLPNSDYVISFELVNATYANVSAALLDFYDTNNVNFAYPTPSQLKRVSDDAQMSSLSQPISGRFYYKVSAHSLKQIRLQFRSDGYGNWSGTIKNIQLEHGTEATNYSPTITPTTTPVNLGRTVYGGTLDVVAGVLTVYPFYPSYNGETLNGRWICDRAVYAEGTTPPTGSQVALISGTGTTYTLTGQEMTALYGENYIWANSGDIDIEYTYLPYGLYGEIRLDGNFLPKPRNFMPAREDVYAGEYTTCTGKTIADRIGWKFSDLDLQWDALKQSDIDKLINLTNACSLRFDDADGLHTEDVIRSSAVSLRNRNTVDGETWWRNVSVQFKFIDTHNND